MKLKDGKRYETADGQVVKIFTHTSERTNWIAFVSHGDAGCYYDDSGKARHLDSSFDLIRRHYKKPQPAHKLGLKLGDLVELCGWEDGTGYGAGEKFAVDKNGPYSDDWDFDQPKGERPLFKVVSRS